jgi:hypothetical protein
VAPVLSCSKEAKMIANRSNAGCIDVRWIFPVEWKQLSMMEIFVEGRFLKTVKS